jgi:DnaA family protein
MQHRQLTLPVHLRDDATMDNFLPPAGSEAALAALGELVAGRGEQVIFLHGASGSGKSHLLQACCHSAGEHALYLPLGELADFPADQVLEGVDAIQLLCLDDLQAIPGKADWETALFNLYNRARESGQSLVLAANAPPRQLPVALADLQSRLSWAVVFQLPAIDDDRRCAVLQFRARRRGLTLPADVAGYIVSRAPRSMDALLDSLELLDRASLAQQRHLSIPFVKQTLGF